jgi:hypothetical protein
MSEKRALQFGPEMRKKRKESKRDHALEKKERKKEKSNRRFHFDIKEALCNIEDSR